MKAFAWRLLVINFVLCFALPAVASAQKFVVGYSGITAIQTPFWIIKDAGYFKQEGLDANLIYIAASSTMAQAMMAGEVAISTANSQAVVDTGLQGGDLVAVGAIVNFVALYIIAAPEIKSVQDLRGKPVGVSRFGATTDFAMQMFLKKYGLEPVRDVPIIQIGGLPELAAALSKKSIYAAAMSYPMGLVAQQAGMKVLANLAKEEIPFLHQGLTTTGKFLRDRRAQAKAFVRAYGSAVHFMHTRKEAQRGVEGYCFPLHQGHGSGHAGGHYAVRLRLRGKSPPSQARSHSSHFGRDRQEKSQGEAGETRAILRQQLGSGAYQRRLFRVPMGEISNALPEPLLI
jgi:ABC-type nitrate/sulfonate/bicarbonate transport system substrate-binding protein